MIANLDFAECCTRLGRLLATWSDSVIPERVELLPNSSYDLRYAWMYAYEKNLKRRIERVLGHPLGLWDRRFFGADAPFSEGLSNAFLHGNRHDSLQPIEVRTAVSRSGLAFAIHDNGRGFDVDLTLTALKTGKSYFHVAGNGLRTLAANSYVLASYADGGRCLTLLASFHSKQSDVALAHQPPA